MWPSVPAFAFMRPPASGEPSPAGREASLSAEAALCYNVTGSTHSPLKGRVRFMISAEFFWKVFEATGSISAYLLYRQLKALVG